MNIKRFSGQKNHGFSGHLMVVFFSAFIM